MKMPNIFRIPTLCIALYLFTAMSPVTTVAAEKQSISGAAWLVEWDLESGWKEAEALDQNLDSLQIFAVSFDGDDQFLVNPKLAEWLSSHSHSLAASGRKVLLTIVNDVYPADGKSVAKDTELVTRLMATPESREKHKRDLLQLLDQYGFDGLDMDYEKVADKDWQTYLDFCGDLHSELAAKDKTLRVIVEPKPVYYQKPYPKGPEYVVMAYNLFGFHTKKGGPKCDMRFIGKLAAQRRKTGVDFRLALSLGGFLWKKDGKTTSLTEAQALDLVEKHKARQRRDPDSAYQYFTFTDESGAECEVWYADGQTLVALMRTAKGFGFTGIDLWRLGGIAETTIETLKSTFSRQSSVHHVGANALGGSPHTTITAAIAAANPGDTIYVSPGEYRENVVVNKPNLTLLGDVDADAPPQVKLIGSKERPTLADSENTLWRGFAFSGGSENELISLDSFTGRFEHCLFDLGPGSSERTALQLYGGSPSFQACRFLGDGGAALAIVARTIDHSLFDFTYCLFDGFADGLATIDENADLRFANCIFTNNGILFTRQARFNGNIDMHNSVLYFNNTAQIATERPGARPIHIRDTLYTPHFNDYIWVTGELLDRQPALNVERTHPRAPRFARSGRPLYLNLGIDDVINTEVWEVVSAKADKYGMKVSLAVNSHSVTEDDAEVLRQTVLRGHEVGSHTADHLAIQPDPPLNVGYMPSGIKQASLTIVPGEALLVRADGKEICSIPFTPGMNINALATQLEKAGVRTFVSFYHGGTPVELLSPVENLDITFPQPSVPLYTDNIAFIQHELSESLADLKKIFPERNRFVFMCPFGVNSEAAKKIMTECGYFAGRSAVDASSTIGRIDKDAVLTKLDIFNIPSSSFQTASTLLPDNDLMENVLLTMEYLKRHFSVYSIYSHTWKELSPEGWDAALELFAADPQIRTATLQEMIERIESIGTRHEGNIYSYPVEPAAYDYRPRKGSPLVEAGEFLGLPFDFSGLAISPEKKPNIGLYQ